MTLRPLNDRIKVSRIPDPSLSSKPTIYTLPDSAPSGPQWARVVAVPLSVDGVDAPLPVRQGVAVGDTVVLGAGVGIEIKEGGESFWYVLPGDFLTVDWPE